MSNEDESRFTCLQIYKNELYKMKSYWKNIKLLYEKKKYDEIDQLLKQTPKIWDVIKNDSRSLTCNLLNEQINKLNESTEILSNLIFNAVSKVQDDNTLHEQNDIQYRINEFIQLQIDRYIQNVENILHLSKHKFDKEKKADEEMVNKARNEADIKFYTKNRKKINSEKDLLLKNNIPFYKKLYERFLSFTKKKGGKKRRKTKRKRKTKKC